MSDEERIEGEAERESSIDVSLRSAMGDAYVRSAPTTFSSMAAFGTQKINDSQKLFSTQREPILKWLTYWVVVDIFDNWFRVVDPSKPDDMALDEAVQRVLKQLNAKQVFTRLFTFERRYGTAILLCAYTGFGSNANWESAIYETGNGLNLPQGFKGDGRLLQITPYPWTKVKVESKDKSVSSLRFGKPEMYIITRGIDDAVTATTEQPKVHWSRVIHAATRLDESAYEGESVVDAVWDDATGFRNMRWAEYETMFRIGGAFPKFTFPWATREQIAAWVASGEMTNLNARGYFVCGEEGEDVEFIGGQAVITDPGQYNELAMNMMAMASRIPKDMLKGASAGTVAGSEVNERSYWNFITSEQSLVEPVVRELIDRLIDTGQIEHVDKRRNEPTKDYEIKWNYPEIVSEKDRATIDFLQERTKAQSLDYLTVNERRDKESKPPVEGGDVVLGILRATKLPSFQEREGGRPSPEERRPEEQAGEEHQESKQ